MVAAPPRAATVGEIARRTRSSVSRIQYIIRSRGLQPAQVAGTLRIFSDSDVQFIESVLRRISAERGEEVACA